MTSESDNYPTFNYKDYDAPSYFTAHMKVGDIFYYVTKTVIGDSIDKFKLIITDKRHDFCNTCPLIKHHCEGISCNIQAKKIINIKHK